MTRAARCLIFYCDQQNGNICCVNCRYKKQCRNICLNSPEKCNCFKREDRGKKPEQKYI